MMLCFTGNPYCKLQTVSCQVFKRTVSPHQNDAPLPSMRRRRIKLTFLRCHAGMVLSMKRKNEEEN